MPDCKPGMWLRVVKLDTREEWVGTVRAVVKPNRYSLLMHVPTYVKDGTQRDKWKPKMVTFGNSSKIRLEVDYVKYHEFLESAKQARRNYKDARGLLANRRSVADAAFAALGLSKSCTQEEFKAKRRLLLREFHEDAINQRVAGLPAAQADLIRKRAKLLSDALAAVDHFLKARDGVQS